MRQRPHGRTSSAATVSIHFCRPSTRRRRPSAVIRVVSGTAATTTSQVIEIAGVGELVEIDDAPIGFPDGEAHEGGTDESGAACDEKSVEQRLALRQRVSARLLGKLHQYLLELQPEVLPKSPSGAAVRYALNQWEALTRFLQDGELEIDNGATERANRDIALGRGNWTFFGSDGGGETAAVLRSFIASCKRSGIEPFAWFCDVLSRIPAHSIARLTELLPHNCKPTTSPAQA